MRTKIKSVARIVLIIIIILNLAFIYTQSLIPPEKSSQESDAVGGIISEIIPPDTPEGKFVLENLRKIAHFTEFAFLGFFVSLYIIIYERRVRRALLSAPAALILALLDETLQYLSGRGPLVSDVWIDFFGFVTSSVNLYTVYVITAFVVKKCKQRFAEDINGQNN